MKVKVTWVNNNPFVLDFRNMSRCSEADVPAEMNYDTIEDFAREATPQGFHLRSIDVEGKVCNMTITVINCKVRNRRQVRSFPCHAEVAGSPVRCRGLYNVEKYKVSDYGNVR